MENQICEYKNEKNIRNGKYERVEMQKLVCHVLFWYEVEDIKKEKSTLYDGSIDKYISNLLWKIGIPKEKKKKEKTRQHHMGKGGGIFLKIRNTAINLNRYGQVSHDRSLAVNAAGSRLLSTIVCVGPPRCHWGRGQTYKYVFFITYFAIFFQTIFLLKLIGEVVTQLRTSNHCIIYTFFF